MSRRKSTDNKRTLTKVAGGKSLCISIPLVIIRELNWEPSQVVQVKRWGKKIIIVAAGEGQETE